MDEWGALSQGLVDADIPAHEPAMGPPESEWGTLEEMLEEYIDTHGGQIEWAIVQHEQDVEMPEEDLALHGCFQDIIRYDAAIARQHEEVRHIPAAILMWMAKCSRGLRQFQDIGNEEQCSNHARMLALCCLIFSKTGVMHDARVQGVAQRYTGARSQVLSGTLTCKMSKLDHKSVEKTHLLSGMLHQLAHEHLLSSIVRLLTDGDVEGHVVPLVLIEHADSDEASNVLRVSSTQEVQHPEDPNALALARVWGCGNFVSDEDLKVCKVLQVQAKISMLFRIAGTVYRVRWHSHGHSFSLESMHAPVVKCGLVKASMSHLCRPDLFPIKVRTACTDDAAPIIAAERSFREPGWMQLRHPCRLHKSALCHRSTFGLVDMFISTLVNASQSFKSGVSLFRREMVKVIQQRLVVIVGRPPAAAVAHRCNIINTYFKGGN